jgi:RimJ/RimL family protein N-acetyltransferase/nitrite reductase/ring-hydroxylating ferredoxin subunit
MGERPAPPNPPLSDGVVTLRPFRADDAAGIAAACQDPQVARWIPIIPIPYTEQDAKEFILLALQAWADGTSYEFCIADAATDRYLGSVGVHPSREATRYAIGYLVAPEARGRGIATRAVKLALRWALGNLVVDRLALWTLPGNVASQRVAENAGFRYEGLIRNSQDGRDGHSVDAVMFAMTPDDLADLDASAEADADASADTTTRRARAGAPALTHFPRELRASGSRAAPFVDLVGVGELTADSMRRVTIADRDLLVARTPAGIVVTDDRCPHMSAPLSIGKLDGCVVACPLHEGRFDLSNGETVQMPTTGGLDADGNYHPAWSPASPGAAPKPEPPSKKLEARRLTRVNRLRFYPTRIREGRLEAQIPFVPE